MRAVQGAFCIIRQAAPFSPPKFPLINFSPWQPGILRQQSRYNFDVEIPNQLWGTRYDRKGWNVLRLDSAFGNG